MDTPPVLSVKVGTPTCSGKDVVAVVEPEVPVTVTVLVPTVAVLVAVNVSVLDPPVISAGEKLAVTPLGRPETVK
jgi:hypothetical protein